jgi:tight adherence protein C
MGELAVGALLGLGLFVLVSGSRQSAVVARLTPFIRDRSPLTSPPDGSDSVVTALRIMGRGPIDLFSRVTSRHRRSADVSEELPAVLDLIGLCVSSGMSVPATLERVGIAGEGVLADECRMFTAEVAVGVSVSEALHNSDQRIGHDGWSRLIEHLVAARRHGTPLSEILRSLADDEHQQAGRRLLESASAKETLMMFPLVFVILPVTVVMAIFPGLTALGSIGL